MKIQLNSQSVEYILIHSHCVLCSIMDVLQVNLILILKVYDVLLFPFYALRKGNIEMCTHNH